MRTVGRSLRAVERKRLYDRLVRRREYGVQFLNRVDPAWQLRVDAARLNMQDPEGCVLAQLAESYRGGVELLAPPGLTRGQQIHWAVRLGFDVPTWERCPEGVDPYEVLTRVWRAELAA